MASVPLLPFSRPAWGGLTMPIAVSCPECASGYRVPDTAAGKAITCKKCGARVAIGTGSNGTPTSGNGGGRSPKKKGGGGVLKILLIIGGILALGCFLCVGISGLGTWWAYAKAKNAVNDAFKDAPFKDAPKDAIIIKDGKDAFKDAFKDFGKEF